jgi:hypothetical protein
MTMIPLPPLRTHLSGRSACAIGCARWRFWCSAPNVCDLQGEVCASNQASEIFGDASERSRAMVSSGPVRSSCYLRKSPITTRSICVTRSFVHALAPFPQLTPTCWIQKAILNEEGHILAWESGALYPRGSLDQPDGNPVTLFRWASETAADARERLIHLTSELATLIEEVGEVAPPPSVWVPTSGPALLARPTTSSLIEDGLTYGDERS